jgi:hypothetical protein
VSRGVYPRPYTKGDRRRARQSIRNALGVAKDGPPRLRTLLRVAGYLDYLLRLTTDDVLRIRVAEGETGRPVEEDEYDELVARWREW